MSTYFVDVTNGKFVYEDHKHPIEMEVIEDCEAVYKYNDEGRKDYAVYPARYHSTKRLYPIVETTEMDVHGNWNYPWHLEIKHGKIFCTCEARYSDGIHRKKKVFPLQDGVLGLSGGHIDDRYAYFRTDEFQNWLNKMGLTAVMRLESPKFSFTGHNAYCGAGSASYYCATDGRCIREAPFWSASWLDDYDGFSCDDSETTYEFDNCSWVILSTVENYRDNHNSASILYVPKGVNPMDLTDKIKRYSADLKAQSDGSSSGIYPEGGYIEGYDNEMYPEEDYED